MFQYLGDFHIIAWTCFTNKKVSQVLTQPLTKKPCCNCKYALLLDIFLCVKIAIMNDVGDNLLGGGFKHFLMFIPIWGRLQYFQLGWNHQPVYHPLQRWWMDHFTADWEFLKFHVPFRQWGKSCVSCENRKNTDQHCKVLGYLPVSTGSSNRFLHINHFKREFLVPC